MSGPAKDGGPAFPVHPVAHERGDAECAALSGMTLRDYFAAHTDVSTFEMKSMEAAVEVVGRPLPKDTVGQLAWQADLIAKARYAHADAMIRARENITGAKS